MPDSVGKTTARLKDPGRHYRWFRTTHLPIIRDLQRHQGQKQPRIDQFLCRIVEVGLAHLHDYRTWPNGMRYELVVRAGVMNVRLSIADPLVFYYPERLIVQ
jgi:hypothetical protein